MHSAEPTQVSGHARSVGLSEVWPMDLAAAVHTIRTGSQTSLCKGALAGVPAPLAACGELGSCSHRILMFLGSQLTFISDTDVSWISIDFRLGHHESKLYVSLPGFAILKQPPDLGECQQDHEMESVPMARMMSLIDSHDWGSSCMDERQQRCWDRCLGHAVA